jgi:hypothetical protein
LIKNNGVSTFSNITAGYSVDGGVPIAALVPGTLSALASRTFTFPTPLTLAGAGTYTLKAWTQHGMDAVPANDTSVRTISVSASTPVTLPVMQDFETFALCDTAANCDVAVCALSSSWTNASIGADSVDWRVWRGPTPTNLATGTTGPFMDYKPGIGSGRYVYLEADGCAGKTAHLISPCINLAGVTDAELHWGYHMMGAGTGELHIDVHADGVWSLDVTTPLLGAQGTSWNAGTASLAAFAGKIIKVRFRGITGPTAQSDIAVDGIQLLSPASVTPRTVGILGVSIYPNPSATSFSVTLTGLNAPAQLTVSDVSGRIIEEQVAEPRAGAAQTTIQLRAAPAGVYFLSVRSTDGSVVRKLVKL